MRRWGKKDANHREIVQALRAAGRSVLELHEVGSGCPDIVVAWGSQHVVLMEIKNPRGRNRVERSQRAWALAWKGPPAIVVRSAAEALAATGVCAGSIGEALGLARLL